MTPIDPVEIIDTAADILNSFWPVISILGGLTIGLAIINSTLSMLKKAMRVDEPYRPNTYVRTVESLTDYEYEIDEEYEEEQPAPAITGLIPVECRNCYGVTEIAGPVGRCKYCGKPLSADHATQLTGNEPMVRKG